MAIFLVVGCGNGMTYPILEDLRELSFTMLGWAGGPDNGQASRPIPSPLAWLVATAV